MPGKRHLSKFISLVLRHRPEAIGLQLDLCGWALIEDLVRKSNKAGVALSETVIRSIAAESDKQRFCISDDGRRIRANYGHSIKVDLNLLPGIPPESLYHGTASHLITSIMANGILSCSRQMVHLSENIETAITIGKRHGAPVVLTVLAGQMHRDGFKLYLSRNGIWMTDHVPKEYIDLT